ncbi:MAG: transglutaminase-like cysteine peptidase [Alphaproteobacteria bacterium]
MPTAAALLSLLMLAFPLLPAHASRISLFGTSEQQGSNLAFFPQFVDMLHRYSADLAHINGACESRGQTACLLQEWASFITSVQGLDRRTQIERVNSYINAVDYIEDIDNWGVEDFWATPAEFFARSGDCEDYAIAKYMTLRSLGVPIESMRIVVLMDNNLGIGHAVLVVYTESDVLVLDNQIDQVVSQSSIRHYQPVYSLNERNWWRHR